jgi:hypothetical protein
MRRCEGRWKPESERRNSRIKKESGGGRGRDRDRGPRQVRQKGRTGIPVKKRYCVTYWIQPDIYALRWKAVLFRPLHANFFVHITPFLHDQELTSTAVPLLSLPPRRLRLSQVSVRNLGQQPL